MAATWHRAMRIGIELVDDDHKQLFALVGEFNQAAEEQGGQIDHSRMLDVLKRLDDYVHDHFQREEQMQLEAGYDGYEENKRQHDELIRTLAVFTARYRAESDSQVKDATREMQGFLSVWLTQHIIKTDLKMRGRILPWAG
jgi:hemerythrin